MWKASAILTVDNVMFGWVEEATTIKCTYEAVLVSEYSTGSRATVTECTTLKYFSLASFLTDRRMQRIHDFFQDGIASYSDSNT